MNLWAAECEYLPLGVEQEWKVRIVKTTAFGNPG